MRSPNPKSDVKTESVTIKDILSFNEACSFLDVSSSWLYKLTCSNSIPYYKPNGKKIYFKRNDLEDWLLRNKVKSSGEINDEALNHSYGDKQKH